MDVQRFLVLALCFIRYQLASSPPTQVMWSLLYTQLGNDKSLQILSIARLARLVGVH